MKCLLLLLCVVTITSCYKQYQNRIPNGDKIPSPCDDTIWKGVGHWNHQGGGLINAFGDDFKLNVHEWTPDLCRKDSDGDGVSNGIELGDPNCLWTPGNNHPLQPPTGHPGICEPVGSSKCSSVIFSCQNL